jgi:hypothetical protein
MTEPSDQHGQPSGTKPGLGARYRHLPGWVQILLPVAAVLVILGAGLLIYHATRGSNSSTAEVTTTTTGPPEATTTTETSSEPLRNTAVVVAVHHVLVEDTTTTTSSIPTSTELPTSATSAPPTSSESPASTLPPTTETATTVSSTTTSSSTTTDIPTTGPPSTAPPVGGQLADSPAAFATAWNMAAANTDVPAISEGPNPPANWTRDTIGDDTASILQVGANIWLVAISADPTAPVHEALLVWGPNLDSSSVTTQNQLYRDAFQVLMKTVNDGLTGPEAIAVPKQLGLSKSEPPFPAGTQNTAELKPQTYTLFTADPADPSKPGDATVISVVSSST